MRKSLGRLASAAALATLALLISPISTGNASTIQSVAADVEPMGFWGYYPNESTLHAYQQCHDIGRAHMPAWWSTYICEEHPNIKTRYRLKVLWN